MSMSHSWGLVRPDEQRKRRWWCWLVERRRENINRETLHELWESQHASASSLHICLFIPGGDCNSRRNRARVRSPLPLHTRNICLLTQARCPVTQALANSIPPSHFHVFFSLCPCLVVFDGVPAAGSSSCCTSSWPHCLLLQLSCPNSLDSLSWNSKAESARGWHSKVEICIKI